MGTIVVAGAVANKPLNGGEAWVRLSWAMGLRRLGFDVYLIEEIDPAICVDGLGAATTPQWSVNRAHFERATSELGPGRAALFTSSGDPVSGVSPARLADIAADATLVNISGNLQLGTVFDQFPKKIYIDIDPGHTQCWHRAGDLPRLTDHDCHFTIGESIGRPECGIPDDGVRWHPTRQPVVLDDWPVAEATSDAFTTVGSWRGGLGRLELAGRSYGQKAHEWRRMMEMPQRSRATLEAALQIDPGDAADRDMLISSGWRLVDPLEVACDPDSFRRYVQESAAEFSVAQGLYVEMATGWFSDRTVRYLASGKPVLVQETGFSAHLPVGDGLLPFVGLEDATAGIRAIARRYGHHSAAAREMAERFFDSDKVLSRVLDEAGVEA